MPSYKFFVDAASADGVIKFHAETTAPDAQTALDTICKVVQQWGIETTSPQVFETPPDPLPGTRLRVTIDPDALKFSHISRREPLDEIPGETDACVPKPVFCIIGAVEPVVQQLQQHMSDGCQLLFINAGTNPYDVTLPDADLYVICTQYTTAVWRQTVLGLEPPTGMQVHYFRRGPLTRLILSLRQKVQTWQETHAE